MWLARIVRGSRFWRTIELACRRAITGNRYEARPMPMTRAIAQSKANVGLCVTGGVTLCIADGCLAYD